jgi:mRNA interferase MazF
VKRGEVRWFTFKPPDKRRPVLILTRTSVIRYLNAVTIAPITTVIRNIPSEVFLSREDGLQATSVVNLDNIHTVPKDQLGQLITHLSSERMEDVERAIRFALGFESSV